jgi:hypothetical protein
MRFNTHLIGLRRPDDIGLIYVHRSLLSVVASKEVGQIRIGLGEGLILGLKCAWFGLVVALTPRGVF